MVNRQFPVERLRTDLLIIGTEGAGCMAAIGAEDPNLAITMVTKGQWGKSGATVTGAADFSIDSRSLREDFGFTNADARDSKELFFRDTVKGGKYLNNQRLLEILVEEAPRRLRLLMDWGVKFSGRIIQPSGHGFPRGLLLPGPNFVQALKKRARAVPNLAVLENTLILDLLTEGDTVKGALAVDLERGRFVSIEARGVILAAGGGMSVYKHSTAPAELTGDGYALAVRAGATLVDMEFPMFFPGLFAWPPALQKIDVPYHLSAAGHVFGHMYNKRGDRFMRKWDPERMERTTRDIVSVGMYNEILSGNASPHGGVYVSIKHLPDDLIEAIIEWDPARSFKKFGFGKACFDMKRYLPDLKRYGVEAVAACHFFNGGVGIDEACRTDVQGLFAAGEVAGGIHGANRLSGNAFADFMVFGPVAGASAREYAKNGGGSGFPPSRVDQVLEPYLRLLERPSGFSPFQAKARLQSRAWEKIGIIRMERRIEELIPEIQGYWEEMDEKMAITTKGLVMNQEFMAAVEARNMAENILMIALAAGKRKESRGAHYLTEHPHTDYSRWTKNIRLKAQQGKILITLSPVVQTAIQPPEGILPYGKTE